MTRSASPAAPVRRRRLVTAVATVTLLVTPVAAPSSAADRPADDVTSCDGGQVRFTRVDGDLVVPAGTVCEIHRVAVTGDLRIGAGGDVRISSTAIQGDVHLAPGSELRAEASTVWHGIHADGPEAVLLSGTTVHRSIRGQAGFVNVAGSQVAGAINLTFDVDPARHYGLTVRTSQVGGWVNLHRGHLSLWDADLERGLTAKLAQDVEMCSTHVADDVAVRWARGVVEMGADLRHEYGCLGAPDLPRGRDNVVGGSLHLVDGQRSVLVRHTVVAGDLVCTGNTGPRGVDTVHESVVVHGVRSGQCA